MGALGVPAYGGATARSHSSWAVLMCGRCCRLELRVRTWTLELQGAALR